MGIGIRNTDNHVIIDIHSNELDFKLVKILRNTLRDLISKNQFNIIVNFSLVNSIDSSALGCLVSAHKKCVKKGGEIKIYGAQPDILMIFYIIQLDKYINMYNNEFDAIEQQNILVNRRFKVV